MKIGGEEVVLVTDFAELRTGMIVWTKPCRWDTGHSAHRHILLGLSVVRRLRGSDDSFRGPVMAFGVAPTPSCSGNEPRFVSRGSVAAGVIYRVVDPLMESTERTRTKEISR